jgi:hypothetical protein
MAISEESRHRLYGRLETVLGPEEAATMMAHLPPVGWADVATRRDVDMLGVELRSDMAVLRSEMAVLGSEMSVLGSGLRGEIKAGNAELLRTLFFAMVASNATLVGLVFAAVKLA